MPILPKLAKFPIPGTQGARFLNSRLHWISNASSNHPHTEHASPFVQNTCIVHTLAHLQTSVHGAPFPTAHLRPHRLVIESSSQALTAERAHLPLCLGTRPIWENRAKDFQARIISIGIYFRGRRLSGLGRRTLPTTQPPSTYIYEPKGLFPRFHRSHDS